MAKKAGAVPRPLKSVEFTLICDSNRAAKSWRDLCAVRTNDMANAWDLLTKQPLTISNLQYPLRHELSHIASGGTLHELWQLKLSPTYGARIWYYVHEKTVVIVEVHTNHPNQTK